MYNQIIDMLGEYGTVLTEHIGNPNLTDQGTPNMTDVEIYEEDVAWVNESDWLVAEVTQTSHGVGYEIGWAHAKGKNILCLYREQEGKKVSAMISGNKDLMLEKCERLEDLEDIFDKYLAKFPA